MTDMANGLIFGPSQPVDPAIELEKILDVMKEYVEDWDSDGDLSDMAHGLVEWFEDVLAGNGRSAAQADVEIGNPGYAADNARRFDEYMRGLGHTF